MDFLTPSASILKMHAIKVTIEKDERKKELVTSYCLLPSAQKWSSPNFQLLCSCSTLCIPVEGTALVRATES